MADGKPIFYDEERRRWRRTRRVLEISGALFAFIVVVFFINVLRKPDLPELLLPDHAAAAARIRGSKNAKARRRPPRPQETSRRRLAKSPTITIRCARHSMRMATLRPRFVASSTIAISTC